MDSLDILYNRDRKMTKDEARLILEKSKLVASWINDREEIWHFQIGELYQELPDSISFVVYPFKQMEISGGVYYGIDQRTR